MRSASYSRCSNSVESSDTSDNTLRRKNSHLGFDHHYFPDSDSIPCRSLVSQDKTQLYNSSNLPHRPQSYPDDGYRSGGSGVFKSHQSWEQQPDYSTKSTQYSSQENITSSQQSKSPCLRFTNHVSSQIYPPEYHKLEHIYHQNNFDTPSSTHPSRSLQTDPITDRHDEGTKGVSSDKNPAPHTQNLPSSRYDPPTYQQPPVKQNDVDQPESSQETLYRLDILSHSLDRLVEMLSELLSQIVTANDLLHEKKNAIDRDKNYAFEEVKKVHLFMGANKPQISIHKYLHRILKYCPVTGDVFLTLLVYFDRLSKRVNDLFAAHVAEGSNKSISGDQTTHTGYSDSKENSNAQLLDQLFVMNSYNIHRLIITGVTVASKFMSDIFYKNSRYAKVGGLPLDELNNLELNLLFLMDFQLVVQPEQLQKYGDLLLCFWNRQQRKRAESQLTA